MFKFLNFSLKFTIISILVVLLFSLSTLWYFSIGLPDYKKLSNYQPPISSRVYSNDGKLIAEYALQNNVQRLIDDHDNAKTIALALSKFSQIEINVDEVETNIVYFRLNNIDGDKFEKILADKGLYVSRPKSKQEIRIVTHIDINDKDIKQAIEILESVITSLSS